MNAEKKLDVPFGIIDEVLEFAHRISTSGDSGMYEFVLKELKGKKGDKK